MKKSNIFAYIELTKLVEQLNRAVASEQLKQALKSQSAYFNIIEPRYFSDELIGEWETILGLIKHKGAKFNEEGKIVSSAVTNTIEQLTERECQALVAKVISVHDKVKNEFR